MSTSNEAANRLSYEEAIRRQIDGFIEISRTLITKWSDDNRLRKDSRPFDTVLEVEYLFQSVVIEMRISVVWMPLLGSFEVNLETAEEFEVVEYADDVKVCERIREISERTVQSHQKRTKR